MVRVARASSRQEVLSLPAADVELLPLCLHGTLPHPLWPQSHPFEVWARCSDLRRYHPRGRRPLLPFTCSHLRQPTHQGRPIKAPETTRTSGPRPLAPGAVIPHLCPRHHEMPGSHLVRRWPTPTWESQTGWTATHQAHTTLPRHSEQSLFPPRLP